MARPFHVHLPYQRLRVQRPPGTMTLLLILLLALVAALWMSTPPQAALLPIHPPA